MSAPTFKTIAQKDAIKQKFYLAVVDNAGAEHPEFGKVEINLGDIRDILAGFDPVPFDGDPNSPSSPKFREAVVSCSTGKNLYAIVLMGGSYTKS